MQLTLSRLRARQGWKAMCLKQLSRSRRLWIIGFFLYRFDGFSTYEGSDGFKNNYWKLFLQPLGWYGGIYETLTIIAVAQVAILPVITRGVFARVAYGVFLWGIYIIILREFWFAHVWDYVDGGLYGGIFSHSVVMLIGSFLFDFNLFVQSQVTRYSTERDRRRIALLWALAYAFFSLCLIMGSIGLSWVSAKHGAGGDSCFLGRTRTLVSCDNEPSDHRPLPLVEPDNEPSDHRPLPLVEPENDFMSMWTMSHQSASPSGKMFAAGLGSLLYTICFIWSDVLMRPTPGLIMTLSTHSIMVYILRDVGFNFTAAIIPSDSPLFLVPVAIVIALSVNLTIIYYCKHHSINVTL